MRENSVWKPIFLALLFILAMVVTFSYLVIYFKTDPKVVIKSKEHNTKTIGEKNKVENNTVYTHLANQKPLIKDSTTKFKMENSQQFTHKKIDNNQSINKENKTQKNKDKIITGTKVNDDNTSLKQINLATISRSGTDVIYVDKNGIIYFIINQDKKIYMWDITKKKYIHTLPLQAKVISSAYSQVHDRIYLGYNSGKVNYIDLSSGSDLKEKEYVDVRIKENPNSKEIPSGIISVGKYIFIHLSKCRSQCKLVLDKDIIDKSIFNKRDYSLEKYESWSNYYDFYILYETNSRVYMGDNYNNDLKYIVINQDDGNITEEKTLLFQNEYHFSTRIFISSDGMRLLSRDGNVFSSTDLSLKSSLNMRIVDAVWTDNKLFTIRKVDDDTHLDVRNHKLEEIDTIPYLGMPLKLLRFEDMLIIITMKESKITFYKIGI